MSKASYVNVMNLDPPVIVGEKYSILTPQGIKFTVCKPAGAIGCYPDPDADPFKQHARSRKNSGA